MFEGLLYAAPLPELPMRTVVFLPALFVLSACSSMDGTYTGECVMVMSGTDVPYEVEVNITQSAAGTLDGDGEMVDSSSTIYRGDVDGEWDEASNCSNNSLFGKFMTAEIDLGGIVAFQLT